MMRTGTRGCELGSRKSARICARYYVRFSIRDTGVKLDLMLRFSWSLAMYWRMNVTERRIDYAKVDGSSSKANTRAISTTFSIALVHGSKQWERTRYDHSYCDDEQ